MFSIRPLVRLPLPIHAFVSVSGASSFFVSDLLPSFVDVDEMILAAKEREKNDVSDYFFCFDESLTSAMIKLTVIISAFVVKAERETSRRMDKNKLRYIVIVFVLLWCGVLCEFDGCCQVSVAFAMCQFFELFQFFLCVCGERCGETERRTQRSSNLVQILFHPTVLSLKVCWEQSLTSVRSGRLSVLTGIEGT